MPEVTATRTADGAWAFDAALTAGAIPLKPPAEWFGDPGLSEPTALTVTADGRVFGHACAWGVRHIGLPGHRTPPRSRTNYRHYRTGQVETADGSMVATGRISMGGGHASLDGTITAATQHYDDVCSAVADVAAGEDQHGLWFAGALRPDVTPEQIRTLRASSVSGDWRDAGTGSLELCGILAVNVPGFSTPRAGLAASGQEVTALIAAGVVTRSESEVPEPPQEAIVSAPTPPAPSDGPSPDGTVSIGDTGLVGRVIESTDGGDVVVEVTVSADMVHAADEQQAMAASAKLTQRQEMRSLRASVTALSDQLAARDRADAAARLLDGVPAE